MEPPAPFYLGCPEWANADWRGSLFPEGAKPADFLRGYASVFNTVEGNTTFYALPRAEIIARWKDETPETFRFCLKMPQRLSHELRLQGVEADLTQMFRTFAPLESRLGPLFLQLPASFGPRDLPALEAFLEQLSADFRYAVEVRHPEFFSRGPAENRLDALLQRHQVARMVFDTTELYSSTETDPDTREAQRKKPRVAFRDTVTTDHALVRYVGHLEDSRNLPALHRWADQVARWIQAGLTPWFFVHTPGDRTAPELAQTFHQLVRQRLPELPELPAFPQDPEAAQLSLF